jgi:hypothetical protein
MNKNEEALPKSPRIHELQPIPVSECVLPDCSSLELIRPSSESKNAALLHSHNDRSTTGPEHVIGPHRYVPTQSASVIRHLPSRSIPYGSTQELFCEVSAFIAKSSGLSEEEAELLPFICLASFFAPWLSLSPCLLLFGPPVQAVSLLRILGCICHHPVLLADFDVLGLPKELRPTRLIGQPGPRLDKVLGALQFSGFAVPKGELRELAATTVVYVGEADLKSPFADVGFWFSVPPAIRLFSEQDERGEASPINSLQNKLLAYRLQNFSKIALSDFDAPNFYGVSREMARSLGRCIVDAPELQTKIIHLLVPRNDSDQVEGTTRLAAVITEALVVSCHERKASVRVGEIATLANGILSRNGEFLQVNPKEVGAKLKKLGFRTTRLDSAGRGIYLLKEQCAQIHELARSLRVPTLREGLPGCPHCKQS